MSLKSLRRKRDRSVACCVYLLYLDIFFFNATLVLTKSFCRRNPGEFLPKSRTLKVPNDSSTVTEDKKAPKYRTIEICSIVEGLKPEIFTASGWPSVSGAALKSLSGNLKTDLVCPMEDAEDDEYFSDSEISVYDVEDTTSYGTAYKAFGGGNEGKEACYAIAALIEICSIDSMLSNFILPLQVSLLHLL